MAPPSLNFDWLNFASKAQALGQLSKISTVRTAPKAWKEKMKKSAESPTVKKLKRPEPVVTREFQARM
jgi:hypothetical protein